MLVYASAFESGDAGERVAAMDRLRCANAPRLVVLGTDGDEPIDRLQSGMALANLLLRA